MKLKFGCGSILASSVFGSSIPTIVPKGAGAHLILWQNNRQVSPEGMAEWMRLGEELTQRLRRR
jgi:hypothetical protein